MAARDLESCTTSGLSADWRLSIAYNAVLHVATAALIASGYRTRGGSHHYTTIQSLAYTVGASKDVVAALDRFRRKRNIVAYQRAGAAMETEVRELTALAERLRQDVLDWLRDKHPMLVAR